MKEMTSGNIIFRYFADHFEKSQILFLVFILGMGWLTLRSKNKSSLFKAREADRKNVPGGRLKTENQKSSRPLALPGIRLHGAPHEILGVHESASESEILKAYKDAMKLYHPDRIQGADAQQMKFYQEAATKLNQAKDDLLKKVRESK